jgi:hypothetical protein
MGLSRNMDMTRGEEYESDRLYWIGLRTADLIDDGFHRDNALRVAQREWEDGLGGDVDLIDE